MKRGQTYKSAIARAECELRRNAAQARLDAAQRAFSSAKTEKERLQHRLEMLAAERDVNREEQLLKARDRARRARKRKENETILEKIGNFFS